MHVFHAAEFSFQRGGENNDGDLRALVAQGLRHLGAELARTQVIVEHCDVNFVEVGLGFFDRGGADGLITVAAQNGGAQDQVVLAVIEQEDFDRFFFWSVGRHSCVQSWLCHHIENSGAAIKKIRHTTITSVRSRLCQALIRSIMPTRPNGTTAKSQRMRMGLGVSCLVVMIEICAAPKRGSVVFVSLTQRLRAGLTSQRALALLMAVMPLSQPTDSSCVSSA